MIFWIVVLSLTILVFLALFYAGMSGNKNVNKEKNIVGDVQTQNHFKAQLLEIEKDLENSLISQEEAVGAKAELAREMIRLQAELEKKTIGSKPLSNIIMFIALIFIGFLSFGIYLSLGKPNLPASPLASREDPSKAEPVASDINIDDAIIKIEAQLEKNPKDIRAWQVLAPVYMQQGKFEKAVIAYQKIIELGLVNADSKTDLAEALMMANSANASGEPIELLKEAIKLDVKHIRSRFYLASELTGRGSYEEAIKNWEDLLALSNGDEDWVEMAKEGLIFAKAGLNGELDNIPRADESLTKEEQNTQIKNMVEALAIRLNNEGGTISEWTRLVRSYLVLDEKEKAQEMYKKAIKAYPDEDGRKELDEMAQGANLKK